MTTTPLHTGESPAPPSYPPKTPPPPKKPVEPPRPQREPVRSYGPLGAGTAVAGRGRSVVTMANRRGANWALEAQPWAPAKACRLVAGQLGEWGYRPDRAALDRVVTALMTAAVDEGPRISVHLADQDEHALVMVLSHQQHQAPTDDTLLHELAVLGVVSCGVDTDQEHGGRRRWALLAM
ncbi:MULTISPECIES: hypothetical protein [unclassified Streptomyces]|uniref:hypothetical protein n=1 Tax=unclassified Streptomyces TaxID=2593676 RepID=UPI002E1A73A2|nr:hypothetical protein OG217_37875 [Streptomyces sp. NBC_01023]